MWYLVCHNKYSRQQTLPIFPPFVGFCCWCYLIIAIRRHRSLVLPFVRSNRLFQIIIHFQRLQFTFSFVFHLLFSSISFSYNGPRYSHPRSSAPSTTREEVLSLHTRLHPTRFSPLVPAQHPCHFSPPLALPPRSIDLPCHSIFPLLSPRSYPLPPLCGRIHSSAVIIG